MNDGWPKEEMLHPVQARASSASGLMRPCYRFAYIKAVNLKWINIDNLWPFCEKPEPYRWVQEPGYERPLVLNTAAATPQMHKWWCIGHIIWKFLKLNRAHILRNGSIREAKSISCPTLSRPSRTCHSPAFGLEAARAHTLRRARKYGMEARILRTFDGTRNSDGMPGGEAANIPCCASTERQHVSTRLSCVPHTALVMR